MYTYYRKKNYNIMEYRFDSITEFIDYLDETPTNQNIWGHRSLASNSSDISFCRTTSLEDAKEKIKYGWKTDFEQLIDLKIKLEKYIKMNNSKSKQYNDYVGYTPDVKAYLEGNPMAMLNKEIPKMKQIDIYYNAAILGDVDSNQIYNRGAITLSIIEILENLGFSVSLNLFTMSQSDNQIHYAKLNIKKYGERINIQKLYFPLCNPSFLRRLVFRLREITPDINYSWTDGYGRTCDDYLIRDILDLDEKTIVICQPSELGVRGYDIINDANAMFDYINRYNRQDIELEHIKQYQR